MEISKATANDIPVLVVLINSAYRGESSRKGWTTESDLLDGTRTTPEDLQVLFDKPGIEFLKYEEEGEIIGCVNLQVKEEKIYLGMLTVLPNRQAGGIGKKLLQASEIYAKEKGCFTIYMTVIDVRHELIAWYERHGYLKTDQRIEFPISASSGIPRQPLELIVLEKKIN